MRLSLCGIALIFLAAAGCSSTGDKTDGDAPQIDAYSEIVAAGKNIHLNYQRLEGLAEQYLEDESESEGKRQQCAQVAVIGAAAYYWDGNREKALSLAALAYEYAPDHAISFMPEWELHLWVGKEDSKIVKRMAQMKDFVISSANAGFPDFEVANDAFINKLQFAEATRRYELALHKGIQDKEIRKSCYVRWACSLYQLDSRARAEQILLEGWVVDPQVEFHFGEQAMRDYLEGVLAGYGEKYPDLAGDMGI